MDLNTFHTDSKASVINDKISSLPPNKIQSKINKFTLIFILPHYFKKCKRILLIFYRARASR